MHVSGKETKMSVPEELVLRREAGLGKWSIQQPGDIIRNIIENIIRNIIRNIIENISGYY